MAERIGREVEMDKSAGGRHKDGQDVPSLDTLPIFRSGICPFSFGRGTKLRAHYPERRTTHSEASVADDTSLLVSHMNKMQSESGGGERGMLVLIRDCPRV